MLKGIQETVSVFLEKHKWISGIKWISIPILLVPHIIFWIYLLYPSYANKPVYKILYPPAQSNLIGWVILGITAGAIPLLIFTIASKKVILGVFLCLSECIYIGILLLVSLILWFVVNDSEVARINLNRQTYTVTNYLDNAQEHFCLYDYKDIFSFELIDCFYVSTKNESPEMLALNNTLIVFLDGNLRYMYGDNPFNEKWLDSIIFENNLFNLEYIENDEEIIYQLFKCDKNNAQCSQEPFHFTTSLLEYEYGTLHIVPWGEQDHFTITFDDKDGYDDIYYSCDLNGCALK